MTIRFESFRGTGMSAGKQSLVQRIFYGFGNYKDFFTSLQLTYNNSQHFTTINKDMCTFEQLYALFSDAFDEKRVVTVHGDIHENFHMSMSIFDAHGTPQYVKDTYFRITDSNGGVYHILTRAPELLKESSQELLNNTIIPMFYVSLANNCSPPYGIVYPTLK